MSIEEEKKTVLTDHIKREGKEPVCDAYCVIWVSSRNPKTKALKKLLYWVFTGFGFSSLHGSKKKTKNK